jgi:G3E family GTPase
MSSFLPLCHTTHVTICLAPSPNGLIQIKTDKGFVCVDLVLGQHTVLFDGPATAADASTAASAHGASSELDEHHHSEVHVLGMRLERPRTVDRTRFEALLRGLDKDEFYRVKGLIWFTDEKAPLLINWAFGRCDIIPLSSYDGVSQCSFIGINVHTPAVASRIATALHLALEDLRIVE